MKEVWVHTDIILSLWAYKASKGLISSARNSKPLLATLRSPVKKKELILNLYHEMLPFYTYCTIDCFRRRLRLSKPEVQDLYENLMMSFKDINWWRAPREEWWDTFRIQKKTKAFTGKEEFNKLLFGYLGGDKSISQVNEQLFSIIQGIVKYPESLGYNETNDISSFCRLLNALGLIREGTFLDNDFFKFYSIWSDHSSRQINFIEMMTKIISNLSIASGFDKTDRGSRLNLS